MTHSPRNHGPWTIHSTRDVYRDPYIRVWLDQVTRPDGLPGQHVVVAMKPGVCVIPIDADGQVVLTSEFHYAIGRVSLEGVSGGIEPGEDALETARREVAEEVGLAAGHIEPLTTIDPFTSIIQSPSHLYVATELTPVERQLEGTEVIEAVRMPLDEAIARVLDGTISHAPTCVALLLLKLKSHDLQ